MHPLNLASLMRRHRVTIQSLSQRTGLTMKRIREIRNMRAVSYPVYCDLYQAVTGENVFSRAMYESRYGRYSIG